MHESRGSQEPIRIASTDTTDFWAGLYVTAFGTERSTLVHGTFHSKHLLLGHCPCRTTVEHSDGVAEGAASCECRTAILR